MPIDEISFAPPDDLNFQSLVLRASRGQIPVYGVVIATDEVRIVRAFDTHRPENLPGGNDVVRQMIAAWQTGKVTQPWLYAANGHYVVADDYFWFALIERGNPQTFSAQILGEPLSKGLINKVGPLGAEFVKRAFGGL